jgi:hypothetical protein
MKIRSRKGDWKALGAGTIKKITDVIYAFQVALALPTNIRPGWKSLPRTNTLAYYGNP